MKFDEMNAMAMPSIKMIEGAAEIVEEQDDDTLVIVWALLHAKGDNCAKCSMAFSIAAILREHGMIDNSDDDKAMSKMTCGQLANAMRIVAEGIKKAVREESSVDEILDSIDTSGVSE